MLGAIGDMQLECGTVLPGVELAYVTYGTLAPDGRNAVLLTHGYTSSHLFADGGGGSSEGSWATLVGPGRAIDTDRYFVVSSNMLGSAFGSTGPRSIDPRSGRAYGPDFPAITLRDIVTAQKMLLEQLGVTHLAAVAGPSYGGFQGFAWGVLFPGFVDRLAIAVSSPRRPDGMNTGKVQARLAKDPNWNGGHYYQSGGILDTMTRIREETLRGYGLEQELAPRFPDALARAAEVSRIARDWAQAFDGHSLLVLGRAAEAFDATPLLGRMQARVLYALSRTDALFPPSLAPGVMAALRSAAVDATYFEIDSEHGHLASGTDAAKWAPALADLMQ